MVGGAADSPNPLDRPPPTNVLPLCRSLEERQDGRWPTSLARLTRAGKRVLVQKSVNLRSSKRGAQTSFYRLAFLACERPRAEGAYFQLESLPRPRDHDFLPFDVNQDGQFDKDPKPCTEVDMTVMLFEFRDVDHGHREGG